VQINDKNNIAQINDDEKIDDVVVEDDIKKEMRQRNETRTITFNERLRIMKS